ncbi:MAG: DUF1612 and helix-turn-helix domain-containing protein [Rhizobiales bacterium]|nr:DUF1612 and helix-turn-helix domain-containing protein [Hyphomicrobiales bacterium]
MARLDERLRASPIRQGWIARTHYADACASLWLEGELVHVEDLVLHDAHMDVRTPTHELTRAHAVLRARRRIAAAEPGWALTSAGLDGLRGRRPAREPSEGEGRGVDPDADGAEDPSLPDADNEAMDARDGWAAEMAAIDELVARTDRTLAGDRAARRPPRDPLVYDLDWDEDERLATWHRRVDKVAGLPPVLAAALALDAWEDIAPLQHTPWLCHLLAADLLRERGKTRAHLACLALGLRAVPRERRRAAGRTVKLLVQIEAIAAAADMGLKDHDRWLLARQLLERKLAGRRSNSKLPALIDLVLATPLASAGMIAEGLGVSPRAAQDLVAELGLREATGRERYRAWGIL